MSLHHRWKDCLSTLDVHTFSVIFSNSLFVIRFWIFLFILDQDSSLQCSQISWFITNSAILGMVPVTKFCSRDKSRVRDFGKFPEKWENPTIFQKNPWFFRDFEVYCSWLLWFFGCFFARDFRDFFALKSGFSRKIIWEHWSIYVKRQASCFKKNL